MPDTIATTEDVQYLGQALSPDEIGQQIAALMQQEAEATRIALKCRVEAAKLLLQMQEQHGYRSKRFTEFALANGVGSRTDAYDMLLLLTEAGNDVLKAYEGDPLHGYPHWRTVWREIKDRRKPKGRYWLTPPALYRELDAGFHFDFDPCPNPLPDEFNALTVEWGEKNYVNPPFSVNDAVAGLGVTAVVREAIKWQRKGKLSVIVLPVHDYVTTLLEAGAEIRPLGRVRFVDVDTGRPAPHPPNVACFILRPTPWPWFREGDPGAANDNQSGPPLVTKPLTEGEPP